MIDVNNENRNEHEELTLCVIAAGDFHWGRGNTIKEATTNWRRSGGRGKPSVIEVFAWSRHWSHVAAHIAEHGPDSDKPHIDSSGCVIYFGARQRIG